MVFLYEAYRAYVVVKFTAAAGKVIEPSEFSFAIFGPIFCGTIAGCGGAFLPLDKGLDPIKDHGLAPPMFSAFVGAVFYHLFVNLRTDVTKAPEKAGVLVGKTKPLKDRTTHDFVGMHHNKFRKTILKQPCCRVRRWLYHNLLLSSSHDEF